MSGLNEEIEPINFEAIFIDPKSNPKFQSAFGFK